MARLTLAGLDVRITALEARCSEIETKNVSQDVLLATLRGEVDELMAWYRLYNESEVEEPVTEAPPTYFVKNGGNDSLDGLSDATAWATAAKAVATASAGQSVGFKRGNTWREALNPHTSGRSGVAGSPITFRAYGIGDKPKLLGSVNMSASAGWILQSGNIWRWSASSGTTEICALIFNGGSGVAWRKTSSTMTTQGDFYWSGGYTYLYSTSNPGLYYSGGIEASQFLTGVTPGTRNYITIKDLDVRYWGRHGFLSYAPNDNLILDGNDLSYIGPGPASFPLGNGIELQGSTNAICRYNRVHQCLDAGISPYLSEIYATSNVAVYGNIVSNCEYGLEMQIPGTMTYTDVHIDGNIFYGGGRGAWHAQRPADDNMNGSGFQSWSTSTTASSCQFNDNIVYGSLAFHIRKPNVGWSCQGNRYYQDGSTMFRIYGGSSYNFAGWQGAGYDSTGSLISEIAGTEDEIIAALEALL